MAERYVAISRSTGAVVRKVGKHFLEAALQDYVKNGTLALGVWELRRSPWERDVIQARLAPSRDFGGHDDNWRTCLFEFQLRDG
jgi:hypothetical protein